MKNQTKYVKTRVLRPTHGCFNRNEYKNWVRRLNKGRTRLDYVTLILPGSSNSCVFRGLEDWVIHMHHRLQKGETEIELQVDMGLRRKSWPVPTLSRFSPYFAEGKVG
jgi:hypothetical protein